MITSISMDHTQYLGDTIEKIAWEKAGIIKAGVPVIFDASNPGVRTVIEGAAFRRGAARYPVNSPDFQVEGIRGGHLEVTVRLLRGDSLRLEIPFEALYQAQNAALAVRTLEVLRGTCRQLYVYLFPAGRESACLQTGRKMKFSAELRTARLRRAYRLPHGPEEWNRSVPDFTWTGQTIREALKRFCGQQERSQRPEERKRISCSAPSRTRTMGTWSGCCRGICLGGNRCSHPGERQRASRSAAGGRI